MTKNPRMKPLALCTALMTLLALAVPFAGMAVANHGTRTLEVTPETDTNPAGTNHTLTATLSSTNTGSEPIQIDFEIESGPGDGADGNTPFSPDMSCPVQPTQSSCTVTYTSEELGTDTIRAWIDHDGSDGSVEADQTEGRLADECSAAENPVADQPAYCEVDPTLDPPNDPSTPGGTAEPDNTDVVEKEWEAGAGQTLDCEPDTATNPATGTGSTETYTCTVRDEFGNPVQGRNVDGENLGGANDPDNSSTNPPPDYTCRTSAGAETTTDAQGRCNVTVVSEGESGTADLCFWLDEATPDAEYLPEGTNQNDGGDCDLETFGQNDVDMTDTVRKIWETRAARGVDAEPETDTNQTGDNHTITATVYSQFGDEFNDAAVQVKFEFYAGSPGDTDGNSDPATPDRTCTTTDSSTSSNSSCSITYTVATEGTDTVCVFVGATPTTNPQNRTCDGEALNDPDDAAGTPDAPDPNSAGQVDDNQDVVEKIWREPQPGLDCIPETDSNPQRSSHTITCTATDETGARSGNRVIHAEATGANDPDNGDTPTTPDFTCTTAAQDNLTTPGTNEQGTCSFTHGPGASTAAAGTTVYRAWVDEGGGVEADTGEGQNEGTQPGSEPEPDNTDVVTKQWVPAPSTLTITPQNDTATVGTCNPYTITARDANGNPASGAIIDVEQRHERSGNQTSGDEPRVLFCTPTSAQGSNPSGMNTAEGDLSPPQESPDNPGTLGGETTQPTDANGQVTIGISVQSTSGSNGTGNVNLSAFYEEDDDNDDPDQDEPQATATKTWQEPVARTIDCTPTTDSNPTGTSHTVTCTVRDAARMPVQGEDVVFSEQGPGDFTSPTRATTDQNGRVTATTSSSEAGTQTITATLVADQEGSEPGEVDECDRPANDPQGAPAGACSDSVTKTWTQGPDPTEPECNDDVDNDGDEWVDYPDDPGCTSATDDDESNEPIVERGPCSSYPQNSSTPISGGNGNVVVGTEGDDVLTGTDGSDIICGLGGDDMIVGLGGRDQVVGNAGNDTISGRDGNDSLDGGTGDDTIKGNSGIDTLNGRSGTDTLQGGGGEDTLLGGSGNDVMRGWDDDDTLRGGPGRDVARGGKGRRDFCRAERTFACER